MLSKVRAEYSSLSIYERLFILFAMGCSFLITLEASITKAVSNSVFLANFPVGWLPYVWLAVVPLNLAVVSFYNRYIPRWGPARMLTWTTLFNIGINVCCAYMMPYMKSLSFFMYLWKDIYIMLMFHQLWSVLHASISSKRAKYLYGLFYGIGGIGSFLGCLIPGFLAVQFSSEKLLLTTIPFFLLLIACYSKMCKIRDQHPEMQAIEFDKTQKSSFRESLKHIRASRLLLFITFIVVGMQLSSTLFDFKFNTYLAQLYPVKDVRTEFLGRFFSIVNGLNIVLQFVGTFVLIHWLGVRKTHFAIPTFLGVCALGIFVSPVFPLVALSFGAIKAIDYSIFGVVKEMLYIPLKTHEKFQAKATIDIFVYRTSKALASLLIIALQLVSTLFLQETITLLLMVIFGLWASSVVWLYRPSETVASNS